MDWEAEKSARRAAAQHTADRLNTIAIALLTMLPDPGSHGWRIVQRATVGEHEGLAAALVGTRDDKLRVMVTDDVKWTVKNVRGAAWVVMPSSYQDAQWQSTRFLHRDPAPGETDRGQGPDTTCGFALDREPHKIAAEIVRRSVVPALEWAPRYLGTVERIRQERRELSSIGCQVMLALYDGAIPNEQWAHPKEESNGRRLRIHTAHRRMLDEADLYLDRASFKVNVPGHLAAAFTEHLVAFEREHITPHQEQDTP